MSKQDVNVLTFNDNGAANRSIEATTSRLASTDVKSVSILGATGSIGDSVLDVVAKHPDKFRVVALAGGSNVQKLASVARKTRAEFVAIADVGKRQELEDALSDLPCVVEAGHEAVVNAARQPVNMVVSAIVGFAGLAPTLAALDHCSVLSLANKESLVCAGGLLRKMARDRGVAILPMDSEHNAIFQALNAEKLETIDTITITASGGPFRTWTKEEIAAATAEQALRHPNWSMGSKITIDSATLMNKGLEVIEAGHLFPVRPDQLDVVVHPQSIIHGMVSFIDGSVIAELGCPDMRTPIAHCLAYPERIETSVEKLNLAKVGTLTFEKPDIDRFPMLGHALNAMELGDIATNLLNGANEIVVHKFLRGDLSFYTMSDVVIAVVEAGLKSFGTDRVLESLEFATEIDAFARREAGKVSETIS